MYLFILKKAKYLAKELIWTNRLLEYLASESPPVGRHLGQRPYA
jgi:hypothetical protein